MHRFAALCRRLAWVPGAVMSWLLMAGPVLAAAREEEVPAENNWVMAYILVLLGVGLGLMVLLRPGKRSKEMPDGP